ncbi:amidohydrolase family protein [Spartinivicinus poritis]|uniref:Amidohydrolase family protein n=1 Tax=Spartinivicinus poritis TaxID=2994640 RepID=A0ABT5U6M3_9GAMM|nr:amidohydrolase family protein [Spartinivicinus sp. A2-2]MDE1462019.1 amidohydrolase family protein [Spartinivicinus sp. A2-2]
MRCNCFGYFANNAAHSQRQLSKLPFTFTNIDIHLSMGLMNSSTTVHHPIQATGLTKKPDDSLSTQANRCLIRGGFLYTADPTNKVISNSWVLIEGDKIRAVSDGHMPEPDSDTVINANGKMLLPGFINPHWHESFVAPIEECPDDSHLIPTPFSRGGNIEALGTLFGFISTVGNQLTQEEGLAIARWSLWTQLRSGTTTLGDTGSANRTDAMAMAAIELGMRMRVSRWGSDIVIKNGRKDFQYTTDTQAQINDWEALMSTWNNHPSGLIGGMPSVLTAFSSSDKQLIAMGDIASRYQAPYATHLAPLKNEADILKGVFGNSAIGRFDALGLLTPQLLAIHTAYATEHEFNRLIETGVHICHSPAHYGMLGEATVSETGLIGRFIKEGVPVSSSSDGDTTYIGGMPEAMRAAHLGHNEAHNDNTTCPPTTALLTGTRYGAMALGWADRLGSIEVGKQADLVLVDIDDWRYQKGNHPLRTFLVAGSSKDVATVIVAGQVVVKDGQCVNLNEQTMLQDYHKAIKSAQARIKK